MTCFWKGIIGSLGKDDFVFIGENQNQYKNPVEFIKLLKRKAKLMVNVSWQDTKLREHEIHEYLEHIKNYDIKFIGSGHLTGSCDPFLLLICELFCVNIDYLYNGYVIKYMNTKSRKKIRFSASKTHFSIF